MKEKLNSMVLNYQKTRSNTSFTEIYDLTITPMRSTFEEVARSLRASVPEVLALYEDVLMNCVASYSGEHDFENYFKFSLKNKRANLYRNKKKRHQNEVLECGLSSNGDEGAATLRVVAEDTPENLFFRKKRADQRQLIDNLVEKSDETTKVIVETFLACERPTPTAIGKKLGVHHMTVIRKLEKLAGYFDTQQFGDYRDYLFAK
ncbi:hypothetical protein [Bacillus haynesii]|uniref:hypothetical protein n=1 Tax=Bacillus haynesii TaxID=1925021 RepID=UPI0022825CF7|nr:hypothetical protein [Bacillus haynesii]MCY8047607.1 hypothetical protein [Bacillus haynesii]MCY8348075.1 hypothetical protein [Bacillus haynesii]MCY9452191.1 hypothetical protein [Bacillus haynesii]MEC0709158.1 hypothetical protein [Bacillus haynesii]MEC0718991.1 hypothetical protein [Bacillus haynesii]